MRTEIRLSLAIALLAMAATAEAAAPRRTLESYGLLAIEEIRSRGLLVTSGDLGVEHGLFAGRVDAPAGQIVAATVRLEAGARCAAAIGDAVSGTGASCPGGGPLGDPPIGDVARDCGLPASFPGCAGGAAVVVAAGGSRTLPPGTYGDVTVRGGKMGGTLDLAGGSYVFCSLKVLRGAKVVAHAPVRMSVAGTMLLARASSIGGASGGALAPSDVRLFANGGALRLARGARLAARVCAPASRATLGPGTVAGSVVARRIRTAGTTVAAPYVEDREPCTQFSPERNVYFGDLHVHTTLSFDAHAFDVRTTPDQAYRFALGDPVSLPPLDVGGNGTQTLQLERPLDFTAVTDHSEFLGEVEACVTPGSPTYDSSGCQAYRVGGNDGTTGFGVRTAISPPMRDATICGADGQVCRDLAGAVWARVQQAADAAYDRTAACRFTSFVGYEYTGTKQVSTLHRNVIFRNDRVPVPTTVFEQPTAQGLWTELKTTCRDAIGGCDVLAIPHNPNESNGRMFLVEYPGAGDRDAERAQAELRAAMEPLVEVYQHKGDSECMNGLSGTVGATDEQCDFEKRRTPPFDDCGDGTGAGGTITIGCVSRHDYLRGALLSGLQERERLGINPLRLGVIASTDTHNGTPGATEERTFIGHRGTDDDTPAKQLGPGEFYPGGILYSPGGLVGVWAEENSRARLFDALRRREVFGTSGTRLSVRLFGGWGLAPSLCGAPDMLRSAYAQGAPMGSVLPAPSAGQTAPTFLVAALRDPGTSAHPGTPLQRMQIVKGWVEQDTPHVTVYDVAGDPNNGATVDEASCTPQGAGADSLCTVWTDPDFDAAEHAFYYARVLENPSCRWSTYTCNALPPDQRPAACTDPSVARTVQERAWTSPIWFEPAS
ncbi:MAG: DUF3604 domain-containing protein [Candidatus Binatia bacterium]